MAGETLAEAMAVARELRDEGIVAMLNYLGENVEHAAGRRSRRARRTCRVAGAIADAGDWTPRSP